MAMLKRLTVEGWSAKAADLWADEAVWAVLANSGWMQV